MTNKIFLYIKICVIIMCAIIVNVANAHTNASRNAHTNTTAPDTANTAITTPRTYISFDASLSVGAIPLFDTWQNTLPRTLGDLDLTPNFARIDNAERPDNQPLKFNVTESPENFNFVIPFGVSVHRVAHDHMWSLGVSLYTSSKQYQAEISIDGIVDEDSVATRRRVDLQESITLSAITIEAAYRRIIPPTYFTISGSERTTFVIAAGISPLTFFTRTNSMRTTPSEDDARIDAIADTIRNQNRFTTKLEPSGMSLSWRVGISSLRSRGVEIGLYYGGTYSFNFVENGETINESTVSGLYDDDKPLSFMTNRIEFRLSFLRPISRARVVDVGVVDDGIVDDVFSNDINDSNDSKDNNVIDDVNIVEVVDVLDVVENVDDDNIVDNGEEDVIINDNEIVDNQVDDVIIDEEVNDE